MSVEFVELHDRVAVISKDEKNIRAEVEVLGANIILLTNGAFPERYKPAAHDFALCEQGCLLIIAPIVTLPTSRATFMKLNALASKLAGAICI